MKLQIVVFTVIYVTFYVNSNALLFIITNSKLNSIKCFVMIMNVEK